MGKNEFKRRIVPQTPDELEEVVQLVMNESQIFEKLMVKGIVCSGLINMPRDEDCYSLPYLVALVRKERCRAMCNVERSLVNNDLEKQNAEILVANCIHLFKEDPNNMEARDHLQRLADKGYEKAKAALGDAYVETPQMPTDPAADAILRAAGEAG